MVRLVRALWVLAILTMCLVVGTGYVLADGNGSSEQCTALTDKVPTEGDLADADARLVTIEADEGEVITAICIKSGNNMFGGNQHSDLITVDGIYGDCYTVAGLGTDTVTVTAGAETNTCQDISHVDFATGPAPTPVVTPSPSPSESASSTATVAPSQSVAAETPAPTQAVQGALPNTALETPTGTGFWISLLIAAFAGATVFYVWMRLGSPRKR